MEEPASKTDAIILSWHTPQRFSSSLLVETVATALYQLRQTRPHRRPGFNHAQQDQSGGATDSSMQRC